MRLTAKEKAGRQHFVVDPATGITFATAFAIDTDEKWMDRWAVDENGHPRIENRKLVEERIFVDYDVVNKHTGEVVCEVRQ